MRVTMIQPSPSCLGPFCTRMSIRVSLSPSGLYQKSMAYCFLVVVLVVEDDIGEPAIAFHAAHDLDLLVDQVEVGIELGIVKHEGAVLGPLGDGRGDSLVHVLLAEIGGEGDSGHAKGHG